MNQIVVTTGKDHTDIDGLACVLAFDELLKLEKKNSTAVCVGVFNYTITKMIREKPLKFDKQFPSDETEFVVLDVSEPTHFPQEVVVDRVIELIDHHFGFEDFWNRKIGNKAKIEPVGACATLVWEEYKKRGHLEKLSELSAELLAYAIVSNTLNFKASGTTKRDIEAFEDLIKRAKLECDWVRDCFKEQEKDILIDIQKAILTDIKIHELKNLSLEVVIGQMELWDSKNFITNYQDQIEKILSGVKNEYWFFTSPSIFEGKNYLFAKNDKIKDLLLKSIGAKFEGDIGTTDKLWLRKEILREFYKLHLPAGQVGI